MNLCVWQILTLSSYSHFAQGHNTLSIFKIHPLRNSRIVRYNSGIGGQSENSHFAQDISGIVPILTLRLTYTRKTTGFLSNLGFERLTVPFLKCTQNLRILIYFPKRSQVLQNVYHYAIRYFMFCCNKWTLMKLSLKSGSTLLLLLYLCLGQRNNQTKCKTETKQKQVSHPLPSDQNTTSECRF